jgi:hypothetical protein
MVRDNPIKKTVLADPRYPLMLQAAPPHPSLLTGPLVQLSLPRPPPPLFPPHPTPAPPPCPHPPTLSPVLLSSSLMAEKQHTSNSLRAWAMS